MPIININLTGTPDAALSARIAAEITELTRLHLKKDPTITAVALSYVDPHHWFAGGRSLAEQGSNTFWLDIKVVDGSNTKSELSAFGLPRPRVRRHDAADRQGSPRELHPGARGASLRLRIWRAHAGVPLHRWAGEGRVTVTAAAEHPQRACRRLPFDAVHYRTVRVAALVFHRVRN